MMRTGKAAVKTSDLKIGKIKSKRINDEVNNMGKSQMTQKSASRIQSHADKTGTNQSYKSRAQSAASTKKK
jgi:hypothetical protein